MGSNNCRMRWGFHPRQDATSRRFYRIILTVEMGQQGYTLRIRDQKYDPYPLPEVLAMIDEQKVGLMDGIHDGADWITLDGFLPLLRKGNNAARETREVYINLINHVWKSQLDPVQRQDRECNPGTKIPLRDRLGPWCRPEADWHRFAGGALHHWSYAWRRDLPAKRREGAHLGGQRQGGRFRAAQAQL